MKAGRAYLARKDSPYLEKGIHTLCAETLLLHLGLVDKKAELISIKQLDQFEFIKF